MGLHSMSLPDMTIPNGASISQFLDAHNHFEDADAVSIHPPAGFLETLRVKVSNVVNPTTAADFVDLLNPTTGTVYTATAAQGLSVPLRGWKWFALGTTAGVAADRIFKVTKGMPAY